MQKILKMEEPIVRAYLRHAFSTSILREKLLENGHIYQKYIMLEYYMNNNDSYLTYKDYDFFLKEGALIKHYVLAPGEQGLVLKFIKSIIDDGYYFFSYWNEKKVKNKVAYKKYDYSHACLIYGYDDEKKVFYTEGYITENWKWSKHCVSYAEVVDALLYEKGTKFYWCDAYELNSKFVMNFSYKEMMSEFKDYLYFDKVMNKTVYGIRATREFLIDLARIVGERKEIPRTSFYCMIEHRNFMINRLAFLEVNKYIDRHWRILYEGIVEKYNVIQKYALRYSLLRKTSEGYNLICELRELMKKDNEIMFAIYSELDKGLYI